MIVFLNGAPKEIKSQNISQLLSEIALENQRIAIEVNEEIISKSQYHSFNFKENDRIEIIKAVGGG